jgi:hypothetical protein
MMHPLLVGHASRRAARPLVYADLVLPPLPHAWWPEDREHHKAERGWVDMALWRCAEVQGPCGDRAAAACGGRAVLTPHQHI